MAESSRDNCPALNPADAEQEVEKLYDLAEHLSMGQSAISHQLRILRSAGLVRPRRDGKTVFYSLDDEHVKEIIEAGMSHIQHG